MEEILAVCREVQGTRKHFGVDELVKALQLPRSVVSTRLMELERLGHVQRVGPRRWRLVNGNEPFDEPRPQRGRKQRHRTPLMTTISQETMMSLNKLVDELNLPSYGSAIDILVALYADKLANPI